jgi:very-short-patch-repair endonuclease
MDSMLAQVARSQGGMFTRSQARQCGYSEQRIRTELSNRRWLVVVPGVYRLAGAPTTWTSRVWAALLAAGPGAALAGRAAGRMHRVDGVPAYDRLEIAVPLNRRPRRSTSARVTPVPLDRADVTRRAGIPILSSARTVVDLARTETLDVGARIVGDALRTGAVTAGRLAEQLDAARGRKGAERARAAATLADPVLESMLEAELLGILNAAGLTVVPQFEVVQYGLFIARLDFAIEELQLGFESDGYASHSTRPAFERDRERNALLQLAGWTTVSFTATQIRQRQSWVSDVATRMEANRRIAFGKIPDARCG